MAYKLFLENEDGDSFKAYGTIKTAPKLKPGIYKGKINYDTGEIFFNKSKSVYDDLIDLPSKQYTQILQEMSKFLTEETKAKFEQFGFVYKRSCLLHGVPGTGKTCIVNRVAEEVVKNGGIVLLDPNPGQVEDLFKVLDDIQPDTNIMVIFEEFDEKVQRSESDLLNLLDGEIQKQNVMFFATTNYIERIPQRLMRPGRFATVIEIDFPGIEARKKYLEVKIGLEDDQFNEILEKSDGLSIDELKEVVLATKCLDIPVDNVIERFANLKGIEYKAPPQSPADLFRMQFS